MSSDESDSDEDKSLFLGTPLDPSHEELSRKPTPLIFQDRVVDDKGRASRFHGAFTGGFSAGYFNTVGSKEGFTPSTFVSNRTTRAVKTTDEAKRPEDFMDDEDFSELGIAPRRVRPATAFDDSEARDGLKGRLGGSIIPESDSLKDIIVPASLPIGEQLLRRMGWREGLSTQSDASSERTSRRPHREILSYTRLEMVPRQNTFGLGYSGIDPKSAVLGSNRRDLSSVQHTFLADKRPVRSGIKGRGFGVGAQEGDEDDIYGEDNLANYDFYLGGGGDDMEEDKIHGWSAPNSVSRSLPSNYLGSLISGYLLESRPAVKPHVYPPPSLPKGYIPCRRKVASQNTTPQQGQVHPDSIFNLVSQSDLNRIDQAKRGLPLAASRPSTANTVSTGKSGSVVLDVRPGGPPEASANSTSRWDKGKNTADSVVLDVRPGGPPEASANSTSRWDKGKNTPASLQSPSLSKVLSPSVGPSSASSSSLFRPFALFPEKQARFEQYMSLTKQGVSDPQIQMLSSTTEWDNQHEADEFARAASLCRPLGAGLSGKFHSVGVDTPMGSAVTGWSSDDQSRTEKSSRDEAVEQDLYGPLTRDTLEWHPDNLLCKRFNVPNPFPGSSIVGIPQPSTDDRFSFAFSSRQKPTPQVSQTPTLADIAADKHKPRLKSIFSVLLEDKTNKSADSPTPTSAAESSADLKSQETEMEKDEFIIDRTPSSQKRSIDDSSEAVEPDVIVEADVIGEPDETTQVESARPPLDLFKAIFASSESDTDSEDEVEKRKESNEPKTPEVLEEDAEGKALNSEKASVLFKHLFENKSNHQETSRNQSEVSTETAIHQSQVSPNVYGPTLPPSTSSLTKEKIVYHPPCRSSKEFDNSEVQFEEVTKDTFFSSSRHKKKSKSSRKEKKKKKTKKHRSKKSKKTTRISSASSSNSDSS